MPSSPGLSSKAQEHDGQRGLTRTAFGYALRHEQPLRAFYVDGRLKVTNNNSERAYVASGRKNWPFCGSDDHAQSAAVLLSLVANCRLHQLDPRTISRRSCPRDARSTPPALP